MNLKRITCTAGLVLITGSAALVTSASAQAAPASSPKPAAHKPAGKQGITPLNAACGTAGPNLDTTTGHTNSDAVNIRTGSATTCTSVGQAQASHSLDFYCYTVGNDGFTWTYLKDITTGKLGWIRDDLLVNNGSFSYCGF